MIQVPRVIIVGITDSKLDYYAQRSSLDEASMLVETYGGEVVKVLKQNASHRDSSTYIGSGKVAEISKIAASENANIIVVNAELKASQKQNLEAAIGVECKVWDRVQLILEIFKKHASTAESKLQIQLAELHHHGPELAGIGESLSQQGGGIGVRGIGETQSEIMRRHWRDQIQTIEKKLDKVAITRTQQMKHRRQSGVPTVSIVGYTNAGKSTLFNSLGGKEDLVRNSLFATLDSSVSSMYLPDLGRKVFLSDTIGFIQDLPTMLIKAFSSTLQESVNADLLLHVIDISDPEFYLKIQTVKQILREIGMQDKVQIYVLNKADLLSEDDKAELESQFVDKMHVFVSAKKNVGLDLLIKVIEEELGRQGLTRPEYMNYLDDKIVVDSNY